MQTTAINKKFSELEIGAIRSFYLSLLALKHPLVRSHSERVASLASRAAAALGKDAHAAELAGIFHDIGKLVLPCNLFDGNNITPEEYELVKEHVRLGYETLKDRLLFTGLCAGLHHDVAKSRGYGLELSEFPPAMSPATIKKVLDIATIVSICDFVDAYTTRTTALMDGGSGDLEGLLLERYPEEKLTVGIVLKLLADPGLTGATT